MHDSLGHTTWAFSAGRIPAESTGSEPAFTSRDELCILNAGSRDAHLTITVYYADSDPVTGYRVIVCAQRVCQLRVNDLIDPEPVPLGVQYGLVLSSSIPVVVQLHRLDTRRGGLTATIAPAFAESSEAAA